MPAGEGLSSGITKCVFLLLRGGACSLFEQAVTIARDPETSVGLDWKRICSGWTLINEFTSATV